MMARLREPFSEPLVSTFSGLVYIIPEVLTTTPSTCANCGALLIASKMCGGCFAVRYCDRDCQKKHWRSTHSEDCCRVSRSDVRDVLMVNRAFSRPLSSPDSNELKYFDQNQFLRAMSEVERMSANFGYTANFLITGKIHGDITQIRGKLTKAMEKLTEHEDIMMHTPIDDFVVWWSLTQPKSFFLESDHTIRLRIESNYHHSNAITKTYKPFFICYENMDEFRVKNKVDKKSYDDFKHLYSALIPKIKGDQGDEKIRKILRNARDKNIFFREMQVIFAIECVCLSLFKTQSDFNIHMHLYMTLSGLCNKSGDRYRTCPLLEVGRRLLREIWESEERKEKHDTCDTVDTVDNNPISYERLADRLKLTDDTSERGNSYLILFKYLYNIWVMGA